MTMAAIYDYQTGDTITDGLQGCRRCDEAIQLARRRAADKGTPVVLEDDDGTWIVHPDGHCDPHGDTSADDAEASRYASVFEPHRVR